jgi:hypothetical protein
VYARLFLPISTCAYPVFIHIPIMKKPTALVIQPPTAFTLLFCKSLVENEAEKAKSDYDPPSSFQPIRFLLIHRLANSRDNSAYSSEYKLLQGRDTLGSAQRMLDSILWSTNERDEHGTAYAPLVVLRVSRVSATTRWFVQVQLGRPQLARWP